MEYLKSHYHFMFIYNSHILDNATALYVHPNLRSLLYSYFSHERGQTYGGIIYFFLFPSLPTELTCKITRMEGIITLKTVFDWHPNV